MILLETWWILTPLEKLPKNVGDLGQLIVAKGFKNMPKAQKIAQSGHTACNNKLRVMYFNSSLVTSSFSIVTYVGQ